MTQEQIQKYERLVGERYDAQRRLNYLSGWEENLYDDDATENERFYITITRWKNGKVVVQRDTTRAVAEAEFHAERLRVEGELKRIEREIAEL